MQDCSNSSALAMDFYRSLALGHRYSFSSTCAMLRALCFWHSFGAIITLTPFELLASHIHFWIITLFRLISKNRSVGLLFSCEIPVKNASNTEHSDIMDAGHLFGAKTPLQKATTHVRRSREISHSVLQFLSRVVNSSQCSAAIFQRSFKLR